MLERKLSNGITGSTSVNILFDFSYFLSSTSMPIFKFSSKDLVSV